MSDLISRKEAKDAIYESFTPYQSEWAGKIRQVWNAIDSVPTVEAVPVVQVYNVLKETYLEIANGYLVSDLHSDNDKVACVASKFRQTALDKLDNKMRQTCENRCDINIEKLFTQIDCCIKSNEERDNTFTVSVLEAAKDKLTEYQKAIQNIVEWLQEYNGEATQLGVGGMFADMLEIVKSEGGL